MSKLKITHPFWQVLSLGVLAGMRTASAPAITSHILSHHHSKRLEHTPLNFMQADITANALKLMAVGELIVDKLPTTPNRIEPAGIVFRCISGALAGASINKAANGNGVAGALLGASAALASSYLFYFLRKSTVKTTKLIDPLIGVIEDALVLGAGVSLIQIA
jgi:uncharacterized membrane protein